MEELNFCSNGHVVPPGYSACPVCVQSGGHTPTKPYQNSAAPAPTGRAQEAAPSGAGPRERPQDTAPTVRKTEPAASYPPSGTAPAHQAPAATPTEPKDVSAPPLNAGRTRIWISDETFGEEGIDPVVGWLVCVDGVNKGRDYRIHCGYNSIGSDREMRIHIGGDDSISRDHATLLYDMQSNVFMLERTKARNAIRLNADLLISAKELQPYDLIDFGRTKLRFVPFCGELFTWA